MHRQPPSSHQVKPPTHVLDAPPNAVAEALDIPQEATRTIFAYWVLKRRRQRGKPLMRQFVGKPGSRTSSVYSNAEATRQQLQTTRLSLEKARSLCEMVRRREMKKRDLINVVRSEFVASANSLAEAAGIVRQSTDAGADAGQSVIMDEMGYVSQQGAPKWPARVDGGDGKDAMMQQALSVLQSHPCAGPFLFPVNSKVYRDYHTVVQTPMDFATVASRLAAGHYRGDKLAFSADVDLIFDNCALYNGEDSEVYRDAMTLKSLFKEWKAASSPSRAKQTRRGGVPVPPPAANGRKTGTPSKRPRRGGTDSAAAPVPAANGKAPPANRSTGRQRSGRAPRQLGAELVAAAEPGDAGDTGSGKKDPLRRTPRKTRQPAASAAAVRLGKEIASSPRSSPRRPARSPRTPRSSRRR